MLEQHPILKAMTPEARDGIGAETVVVDQLPFRVGRESRVGVMQGHLFSIERRKTQAEPNNELYIRDTGERLNISREHFQIEQTADGGYELVDRGSACGTKVAGRNIGGKDAGGRAPLHDGDMIVIGTVASPYVFQFLEPAH
jgi:hypothetical protein